MLLAPALLMHGGKKHHENLTKSLATLDIGSHSNARCQLLPEAGAPAQAVGSQLQGIVRLGTLPRLPRLAFLFDYSTSMR